MAKAAVQQSGGRVYRYHSADDEEENRICSSCFLMVAAIVFLLAASACHLASFFSPIYGSTSKLLNYTFVSQDIIAGADSFHAQLFYTYLAVGSSGNNFKCELQLDYPALLGKLTAEGQAFGMATVATLMQTAFATALCTMILGGVATILALMTLLSPPLQAVYFTQMILLVLTCILSLTTLVVTVIVPHGNKEMTTLSAYLATFGDVRFTLAPGLCLIIAAFSFYVVGCGLTLTWFCYFRPRARRSTQQVYIEDYTPSCRAYSPPTATAAVSQRPAPPERLPICRSPSAVVCEVAQNPWSSSSEAPSPTCVNAAWQKKRPAA